MRLSEYQIEVIKHAVAENFGEGATPILFGSRVDDQARGGDIDLYIETMLDKYAAYQAELHLLARLQRKLGEQKIDLVVRAADSLPLPVYCEAKRTGIRL